MTSKASRVSASGRRAIVLLGFLSALSACERTSEPRPLNPRPDTVLRVYTVNYPVAWFAQRIGGEHVQVSFPAPAGVDPAFWQPAPETILDYQQSDLVLLNGAGYAAWLSRAALRADRLIDTSALFSDRLISVAGAVRHKHGPEGQHSHGDIAFTTWLDPELAALQAEAILAALLRSRPQHEAAFTRGYEALLADLRALDRALADAFDLPAGTTIVFSHPVYQYLENKYDLEGHTVTWEPSEALTPGDLQPLAGIRGPGVNLVIWEGEPLAANREALAAMGYTSVVFDPAANRSAARDYLQTMTANARRLQEIRR